ncbi:telomerase reverse transcriptase-like isoform X2 [Coffea arabica]|uniref:Telomerase reverse transcriptase n=1 Tax=Coffea arabica TaxID=13443 RepID=A0ABM4WIR7_COFAR
MAKMMKKRRRRVPEVLWRLFHNKARTLADTILSLLPSPPTPVANCLCKGRRCLGCIGDEAMSYLLRPKDPADYRKLLTQCFVVVPENAPTFSGFDPHNRWSQLETVRRSIEMIMREQPTFANVICNAYDKTNRRSSIVEALTSSAWCLLLRRVGDILMVYLLRTTFVFLPLPRRKHHQVAGFPISAMCKAFSKHSSVFNYKYPSNARQGSGKKRKQVHRVDDIIVKQQSTSFSDVDFSSRSGSCTGCCGSTKSTPSSSCSRLTISQKSVSKETVKAVRTKESSTEVCSIQESQDSSIEAFRLPRKRARKYNWQRARKRRQLSCQGSSSLIPCTRSLSDEDNFSGVLHPDSRLSSEKTCCSCCLVFRTLPEVIKKTQIDRQSIFYKLENSSSIFPRKHILNSLKPNSSGANFLFRDIFGLSGAHFTVSLTPCAHTNDSCFTKSTCLYHSLMKQLKILIRKARCCQHLRLLDKHCAVLSLDHHNDETAASKYQGNESERNIHGKEHLEDLLAHGFHPQNLNSSDFKSCMNISKAHEYQFHPSKDYCLKKQVVSFVWAVCRSIVPPDLLGSPHNWRILRKNISKFVCLRRFEKFSLKQCIHKLKISKFSLLSNKHSCCCLNGEDLKCGKRQGANKHKERSKLDGTDFVKHKILESWILWFFSWLVVPLLQTHFYVTESEHGKQELFYYRKSVWKKLMERALDNLKDRSYCELTDASVNKIIRSREFGFSRIRFRPRETGFRILANLKAPSRIPVKSSFKQLSCNSTRGSSNRRNIKCNYFKSVNHVLRGVHVVLKGIQLKEPGKLGSSVFDYTGIYKRFVPFLHLLKSGSSILPGVFIVVCDVAKAFDSIDQNKLLTVMEDIISNDEYTVNKSLQVVCTRKSTLVCEQLALAPQDIIYGSSEVAISVPTSMLHSIFVKEECSRKIKKAEIFSHLNEHIKRNVLKLGDRFYLQSLGISQGSVLSSLLCSFYYGHLENNIIFPFLEKVCELPRHSFGNQDTRDASSAAIHHENEAVMYHCKYLLLRFIDDFIFMSTSKKQASLFFSRLQRGFHGYNCYMNEGKFGVNFDMDHVSGFRSNRLYVGEDGISFLRWSGLLVNCSTLEILADYTRYLNTHLSSSLTISWHDHPARLLKSKLCDYLRPKCHPIFYDTNINSAAVVRLNIYQAFLLCAMKFNCYICSFSSISTFSTDCCMDAIEASLRYMHKLIRRRMNSLHLNCGFRPIFEVGKEEIKWLGLTAFDRVLTRKQTRYRELLLLLRSKLNMEANSRSSPLQYAVDDAHSSLLWKIKY